MAVGTVRFWAAARSAAGTTDEPYDAMTLADAIESMRAGHGRALGQLLDVCSFLVDEQPLGGRDPHAVALRDGGVVEVLPPFAGGAC